MLEIRIYTFSTLAQRQSGIIGGLKRWGTDWYGKARNPIWVRPAGRCLVHEGKESHAGRTVIQHRDTDWYMKPVQLRR